MHIKLPDYILNEWGMPQCNSTNCNNNGNSMKNILTNHQFINNNKFAGFKDKTKKLLPKRQTLDEYFMSILESKNSKCQNMNNMNKKRKYEKIPADGGCKSNYSNNYKDLSSSEIIQQKQHKHKSNELVKQQNHGKHYNSNNNNNNNNKGRGNKSNQNILDNNAARVRRGSTSTEHSDLELF